jgi:hypothetical protein
MRLRLSGERTSARNDLPKSSGQIAEVAYLPLGRFANRRDPHQMASQGFLLGLHNPKDPDDVSEPEDLFHRGAQAEQHELLVEAPRIVQHFDQGRDAGTVDVADRSQVERQKGRLREGREQGPAESAGSAQVDVSVHFHDLGGSHISNRNLHVFSAAAWRPETGFRIRSVDN